MVEWSGEDLEFIQDPDNWPDGVMPEALRIRPEPDEFQTWVVECFFDINHSRQSGGMTVGGIPITEIRAWIQTFEPQLIGDHDALRLFIYLIRACDSVYLETVKKLAERKAK